MLFLKVIKSTYHRIVIMAFLSTKFVGTQYVNTVLKFGNQQKDLISV